MKGSIRSPEVRYMIKLHPDVIKRDSLKFDAKTKDKIKKKCHEMLSMHPEQVGGALRPPLHRYRKLVVFNDCRIVYRVDRQEVIVFVLAVGIRRDLEVCDIAFKRLKKL
jgi:mRNA interferase RelE/StbE